MPGRCWIDHCLPLGFKPDLGVRDSVPSEAFRVLWRRKAGLKKKITTIYVKCLLPAGLWFKCFTYTGLFSSYNGPVSGRGGFCYAHLADKKTEVQ